MEKEMTEVESFYQDVSDLLGIENTYEYNPYTVGGKYRTRWNNRAPGNGRFEGYGLIRFFGASCIHVAINKPIHMNGTFDSKEAVLTALKKALDEAQNAS
jgi:hypothetical protein